MPACSSASYAMESLSNRQHANAEGLSGQWSLGRHHESRGRVSLSAFKAAHSASMSANTCSMLRVPSTQSSMPCQKAPVTPHRRRPRSAAPISMGIRSEASNLNTPDSSAVCAADASLALTATEGSRLGSPYAETSNRWLGEMKPL